MDRRASAMLLALLCLGQGAIREAEAQVPTTGNEPSIEQALACPVGIAAPSECLVRVQGRKLSIVSKTQGQETQHAHLALAQDARNVWVQGRRVFVTLSPRGLLGLNIQQASQVVEFLRMPRADVAGLLVEEDLLRLRLADGEWVQYPLPPLPSAPAAPASSSTADAATSSNQPASVAGPPSASNLESPGAVVASGPPDYRAEGDTLRVYASSAREAPVLGEYRFARAIAKHVVYRWLVLVALAPTGLFLLDMRNPRQLRILKRYDDVAISRLEVVGEVVRYTTEEGERNEYNLPKLLAGYEAVPASSPGAPERLFDANRPLSSSEAILELRCEDPSGLGSLQSVSGRHTIALTARSTQRVRVRKYSSYTVLGDFPSGNLRTTGEGWQSMNIIPGSDDRRRAGIASLVIGGTAGVVGMVLLLGAGLVALGPATHNAADRAFRQGKDQQDYSLSENMSKGAAGLGGAAMAGILIGLPLLLTSGTTVE